MPSERRQPNLQEIRDHDLLIRLDQKVDGLTLAIQRIEDNTVDRLNKLESDHVTRLEYDDHEKRVRFLERYQARLVGGLAALNVIFIIVELYLKFFHH